MSVGMQRKLQNKIYNKIMLTSQNQETMDAQAPLLLFPLYPWHKTSYFIQDE
jgi:hypothetical protein